ncbi:DUF4440 domain-containing protein [Sphingomonas sp. MMS12-HWE2-04]|uniref:DUF4440 domain-containing protein n=1 Tax=Sphingomonas sp. MMS12-HWE2-04 TaxID=3234199 RepID=UPI0038501D29
MLVALLLQTAAPQTAVAAERAFEAAAQAQGQWSAFRAFAADDAVMFVPQPVKAQDWLKDRKDPATSVTWAPAASFVACDGATAINTGAWSLPQESGYFTTIWRKQPGGGWKWTLDQGDGLATPRARPAEARVVKASCKSINEPTVDQIAVLGSKSGSGQSGDGTLRWYWEVSPEGAREFVAWMWDGTSFVSIVSDKVAAPK